MPLAPGSRLGPYEILSPLGAGGMGEVYKARDTRLDRTVAIKILPEALAADPQFRERFDREARTISQLDHPHICTLYDVGQQDGTSFLVMQYLEGETLEQRLKRGALPIDQALSYAMQIASALDKAHRAGIVHRDLKPGNIMLTKSGAMLLDFGLAKASGVGAAGGLSMLPTTPPGLTAQGTILGTFHYMAPEQLEGHEADARTDIFAFGAVLYEMITGQKAFEGRTQASVIAAILERQPRPLSELQPLTPAALDEVIRGCLAKAPDDRWQTVHDVRRLLAWVTTGTLESRGAAVAPRRRLTPLTRVGGSAAVVVAVATAWFIGSRSTRNTEEIHVTRFQISAGPPPPVSDGVSQAISADGRQIAFVAQKLQGEPAVFIRAVDAVEAQPVVGTEGAQGVFWAPDGSRVGFVAGGQLKSIDLVGGTPQTICDARAFGGAAWNVDGTVLFSGSLVGGYGGLYRVPASGGTPTAVTSLDAARHEVSHEWPSFLPDGRHFLFTASGLGQRGTTTYVGSLDSHDRIEILKSDTNTVYSPPGFLLFVRHGALMAQRFDAQRFTVSGEPTRVVDRVAVTFAGAAYAVSPSGVLSYRSEAVSAPTRLTWYDRSGHPLGTVGSPGVYRGIASSPDGKQIAVHLHQEPNGGDLWVLDQDRGTFTRFTVSTTHNILPKWSSDGRFLAFSAGQGLIYSLVRKPSSGAGDAEEVIKASRTMWLTDWTRDGQLMSYTTLGDNTGLDIWVLPLGHDRTPLPFANTSANEEFLSFSPDGHWVAYMSDESGRGEVYVQSYLQRSGKWQISTEGGNYPRWAHNGKELFYLTEDGSLMAVDMQAEQDTIKAGPPHRLFKTNIIFFDDGGLQSQDYDISPDDQRFLVNERTRVATGSNSPITVVLNWTAALKK
jgi:Tol biopolymer transport system component